MNSTNKSSSNGKKTASFRSSDEHHVAVSPLFQFWKAESAGNTHKEPLYYRKIWRSIVLSLAFVSLVPLFILATMEYNVTSKSLRIERTHQAARITSNARRTVTHFIETHRSAVHAAILNHSIEELVNENRLRRTLVSLQEVFGGFVDLGLLNEEGVQIAYSGPFNLHNQLYSNAVWFQQALKYGYYVSTANLGVRNEPHVTIAVRGNKEPNGRYYVLRASINMQAFNELLDNLELSTGGDAFLINHDGILQTCSRWNGDILTPLNMALPPVRGKTQVLDVVLQDQNVVLGYAYISKTPFILIVASPVSVLAQSWQTNPAKLTWLLVVSISCILLVVVFVAAYMVNKIFIADRERVRMLHQIEQSDRMASIGRLASNVAHEVNNPLAIIDEKAGLLHDLITYKKDSIDEVKFIRELVAISASVERCGKITKRLLSFARTIDIHREKFAFSTVVDDVFCFLQKESIYRSITIKRDIEADLPMAETDKGRLQQVLLNLVNNGFQAMKDGGTMEVSVWRHSEEEVAIRVADNGSGIAEEDVKRIFEPFFSTKKKNGGTGLGLSITYGLVRELGGDISVESTVGEGTSFTLIIPIQAPALAAKESA